MKVPWKKDCDMYGKHHNHIFPIDYSTKKENPEEIMRKEILQEKLQRTSQQKCKFLKINCSANKFLLRPVCPSVEEIIKNKQINKQTNKQSMPYHDTIHVRYKCGFF